MRTVLVSLLLLAACQDPEARQAAPPPAPGGARSSPGPAGGGEVAFPSRHAPGKGQEERFARALERARAGDFDAAYLELGELLAATSDPSLAERAAQELRLVQAELLRIPPAPAKAALSDIKPFADRPVSLRGRFLAGGPAGKSGQFFWLDSDGERVRCRYQRLHPDSKSAVLGLPEGAPLLVRGLLRAGPQGRHLDVSLFRLERP